MTHKQEYEYPLHCANCVTNMDHQAYVFMKSGRRFCTMHCLNTYLDFVELVEYTGPQFEGRRGYGDEVLDYWESLSS